MTKREIKRDQFLEFCNRINGYDSKRAMVIIYCQTLVALVGCVVVAGVAMIYHTPLALWGLVPVGVIVKVIGE